MTVMEFQAGQIESAAKMFSHWINTTEAERLHWKPTVETITMERSMLDTVRECVGINMSFAATLRGVTPPSEEAAPEIVDAATAEAALKTSAADLASVVRTLDESDLEKPYTMSWGPMPGMFLVCMPPMNMVYHGGQVNYVQMMAGDKEFHFSGV